MSVANRIFKVRANSDYISKEPSILSFRKGQLFYGLATDHEKGYYFVSTQYAVPFSRNAVNGLVPIIYFDKVDLQLPQKPKRKPVPTIKQSTATKPIIVDSYHLVPNRDICNIQVLCQEGNTITVKVTCTNQMHLITRTLQEFSQIVLIVKSNIGLSNIKAHPDRLLNMERILKESLALSDPLIDHFFTNRENEITASILRRDSGTSEGGLEEVKRKNSTFEKFKNLFV